MAVDLTEGVTPAPGSVDLFDVLRQLPLMTDNFYLQMQARNIAETDRFLEQMEHDLLQLEIQGDVTPSREASFLNAWSQMWVFAFFELMRTWKAPAKDFLNFSRKLSRSNAHAKAQLIENKIAQIKKSRGTFHLKALRWVAENPAGAETALNTGIQRTSLLSRMLADVRTGLTKHQIQGSGTFVPHPSYGRISPLNGSISWRVMYEKENTEALISRRDLADECRAIGSGKSPAPEAA